MPRTRSLAWSELKIGILAIVAIIITAATIFALTGGRGFPWNRYRLKAKFGNVVGLRSGSPVRLAGVEVGSVTGTELTGEVVEVEFEVNKEVGDRITTGSVARIGSVSLLGESAVDITPSTKGMPIPPGGYVQSAKPAAQLSDVTDQASRGVEQLTNLIEDIRSGKGTVGKLMTDDQLYAEMRRFVETASDLTRGIQEGRGSLGKIIKDPKVADTLQASLSNLEQLTRQINSGEGSIGRLLKDDAFAKTLNETTANLRDLTGRINRGEGTAGKLMTDATLFNRLNSVSDRLDQMVTRLNDGQGTAGQLLKDRQLYENMNGAVKDLRTLLSNIQKDPRKYLNIKVSLF